MSTILEVDGLSKSFGAQTILRDIDFSVESGTCVSFIGENGAGKSTLGKCLVGVHAPDAGHMKFKGKVIRPGSPREAMEHGIGLLPQELASVPLMTAYENIVLGNWPSTMGFTSPRAMRRAVDAELANLGIDLDVSQMMSSLSLADRQLVEIVKALMRKADLIVLDEPTAALSSKESDDLIDLLLRLKWDGLSAIYISHRMDEVSRFSDVIYVLRNGEIVLKTTPNKSTGRELITAMLGQEPGQLVPATTDSRGEVACEAIALTSFQNPTIKDISFSVREGEILGIFGVRGSGQDVIAEAFGGMRPDVQGSIKIGTKESAPFLSPLASQRAGFAYVPAERKRSGLILGMSVKANMVLPISRRLSKFFGVINQRKERAITVKYVDDLDVRLASYEQTIGELSGGNQQKVLLASRLAQQPRVLVLHEPTRGVDVGARLQIHSQLRDLASTGMACLLVTSDVEEVVAVSDRVIVLRDGVVTAELHDAERTQQLIIAHATGAHQ